MRKRQRVGNPWPYISHLECIAQRMSHGCANSKTLFLTDHHVLRRVVVIMLVIVLVLVLVCRPAMSMPTTVLHNEAQGRAANLARAHVTD